MGTETKNPKIWENFRVQYVKIQKPGPTRRTNLARRQ